jgi:hypothetical protein
MTALRLWVCVCTSILPSVAHCQIDRQQLFNSMYSQATFLEQCLARNIISSTNVHNENIAKAESLGMTLQDFWGAVQQGTEGIVYDAVKGEWIKVPIDGVNCRFVLAEQEKFKKSLSRY